MGIFNDSRGVWHAIDILWNVVFFVDIVIRLNTGFVEKNGKARTEPINGHVQLRSLIYAGRLVPEISSRPPIIGKDASDTQLPGLT